MGTAGRIGVNFREALRAVFGLRSRHDFFFEESEFFAKPRDLGDGYPDGEGDDEEVDDGLDKFSVGDDTRSDGECKMSDVDAVQYDTDERGDDISDK